ncbi:MAG: dicarboxylate/amino acid:cation symporter [Bacteroidetes bacterium]|nr:MAG: dicarboxylate/amino acid:cation symporter [Bacteroidota bacterium]MBL1144114.1 dicarboxylate/amino acid:cation symporter [Bacteroidota bacterium]MCB0803952.1 dicarboxylate/amino acid:cation symporter [Flavobacteriales bacterium]NOG56909.1 dicarboxylate/amino acid:cation symporter [Bacteroidota bacterium]
MKKLALHWQIIIGLFLGLIYGLIAANSGWQEFTADWIAPWGKIFISMLKMIAVPLVLISLINGVSGLKDISQLSSMGGKTIGIYLITTVMAVTIGLLAVNLIKPGKSFSEEIRQEMVQQNEAKVKSTEEQANAQKSSGPLQFIVDMVPDNFFFSASDNRNMLQIIFFALMFGIALILVPDQTKVDPIKHFFDGANEVILKMVDLIMYFAPIGVFALLGNIMVELAGDDPTAALEILKGLAVYSLTVLLGLLIMVAIVYPMALKLLANYSYKRFFKGLAPAQLLAFSTSSSAATLPLTMERCEEKLGVSNKVASFVLPLGATINMDGTSCYQAVAAVFIAQVYGMDLGLSEQLTIVLTATLASIGSAAVPGAGIIMLAIVLGSVGVPLEGISLIFAVDRPLDMCRTVVNVTGDATVATIVAYTEGELIAHPVEK